MLSVRIWLHFYYAKVSNLHPSYMAINILAPRPSAKTPCVTLDSDLEGYLLRRAIMTSLLAERENDVQHERIHLLKAGHCSSEDESLSRKAHLSRPVLGDSENKCERRRIELGVGAELNSYCTLWPASWPLQPMMSKISEMKIIKRSIIPKTRRDGERSEMRRERFEGKLAVNYD